MKEKEEINKIKHESKVAFSYISNYLFIEAKHGLVE